MYERYSEMHKHKGERSLKQFHWDAYFSLCTKVVRADFVITNDGTHLLKYASNMQTTTSEMSH